MAFLRNFFSASAATLCCLAASSAFAGTLVDGKYISDLGYSINPPAGWLKYDASTAKGYDVIPKNLKTVNFSRFDAIFFAPIVKYDAPTLEADTKRLEARKAAIAADERPAPGTPEGDEFDKKEAQIKKDALPRPPEFVPTISIMSIKTNSKTDPKELVGLMKDKLLEIAKPDPMYSEFKVVKSTTDRLSYRTALIFEITSNVMGFDLKFEHTVFLDPDNERAIIVTCTSDINDHVGDKLSYVLEDTTWCQKALKSINFNLD